MATPTVAEITRHLETLLPPRLAAPWDHIGLQVGNPQAPVKKIYIALDPTRAVIETAIALHCTLLITHHPLYLKPPARFDFSSGVGACIALSLRHKLSIYTAHTNLDAAPGGLNDFLCDKLGLLDRRPLAPIGEADTAYKLVAFIPRSHTQPVLDALFAAGAGTIGAYKNCSFRSPGIGTYLPLPGARPWNGTPGRLSEAEEDRVEVLVSAHYRVAVEQALFAAHPYEEVAFEWQPLAPRALTTDGIGRVGTLSTPAPASTYIAELKNRLATPHFRWIGERKGKIKTIAVCSGSGASFIADAARAGADLYITGDIKYHDALDAQALGLRVADLGHFPTEHWAVDLLAKMVQKGLDKTSAPTRRTITIIKDKTQKDPFTYL